MEPENHSEQLGNLLTHFGYVEQKIREFLYHHEEKKDPNGFRFAGLRKGDEVAKNALTSRERFSTLVRRYNSAVTSDLQIDERIVTIRNAIVHGRHYKDHTRAGAFALINFKNTDTTNDKMTVEHIVDLNDLYTKDTQILVAAAVHRAKQSLERSLQAPD
jgi:hypothetical protein